MSSSSMLVDSRFSRGAFLTSADPMGLGRELAAAIVPLLRCDTWEEFAADADRVCDALNELGHALWCDDEDGDSWLSYLGGPGYARPALHIVFDRFGSSDEAESRAGTVVEVAWLLAAQ